MSIKTTDKTYLALVTPRPEIEAQALSGEYGSFDPKSFEFTLTNVLTPRPWVNVLSNGSYGAVISNFGGGFSWVGNSQLQRLTRWEQDLALDQYGRYLYVYDIDEDQVFSTTFAPVREPAITESVVYGLGYTIYQRNFKDFSTKQTVFVPAGGNCEHWIVEISNHSSKAKSLRLGGYLEWQLGSQGEWHREFHRLFVSLAAKKNTLLAWKRRGLDEGTREAPEAPNVAYYGIQGLENIKWFSDKAQFVGRSGRLDRPEALTEATEPIVTERWDDPVAAFHSELKLQPGESKSFIVTIGLEANQELANEMSDSATLADVVAKFIEVKDSVHERCASLNIKTSSPEFDLFTNGWLPHQAETGRILARSAYFQQGGAYGYRDQLQDSLMLLPTDPDATLRQLILHAEAMYEDGGVRHWWHPGTKIFAESHHCDTCLWLAFGVLEYLDETANLSALNQTHRFLNRQTQQFGTSGSLLDHCLRGINRSLNKQSERGLPLIGGGDWNDGLSHAGIEGKGESVWLAMFLFQILTRFAKVLRKLDKEDQAQEFTARAEQLREAVEKFGWDGKWYIAGTSDNGNPFGASKCPEGSIFLNPQTWSIITGIGGKERTAAAMKEVKSQLVKPYGALLLTPAFRSVDPYVGYITRYAPGLRENGGVYSHASAWAVQAFAQIGDAETAYQLFTGMLPIRCLQEVDSYEAEPFVMPGNVDGPDSPYEGRAGWTWYTGSAAWMRRTAIDYILGVRATFEGLEINPNLPTELGSVSLTRQFRGDTFAITIEQGQNLKVWVDGVESTSRVIAASGKNQTRTIRVAP
ncbi:MAG: glycosyl transferase family 36 [Armatimonadetes bacterium]|nr:glycosyl transferase family 36 [Armatimonadota bacterium]